MYTPSELEFKVGAWFFCFVHNKTDFMFALGLLILKLTKYSLYKHYIILHSALICRPAKELGTGYKFQIISNVLISLFYFVIQVNRKYFFQCNDKKRVNSIF